MAQFDFILNEEDQLGLIEYLLGAGAELVPSLAYESPTWRPVTTAVELCRLISDRKLTGPVAVAWSEYRRYPYAFGEIRRDDGTKFFLKQGQGGPYLDFGTCKTVHRKDRVVLTPGFIGYFANYWIEELGAEIPLCPELKERYAAIRAYVRSIARRGRAGCRTYLVGHGACAALKSGCEAAVGSLTFS